MTSCNLSLTRHAVLAMAFLLPLSAVAQTAYIKGQQEKIMRALLEGGPFAEGSYMECVNTNYRLGLTVEQVIDVCGVRMDSDLLEGYGSSDTINAVLDGTGIDAFDPGSVQASCSTGDPTLSQSKGDGKPLWGSKPTASLFSPDKKGVPHAGDIPLLQKDRFGYPVTDSNHKPTHLYGNYSWGGKGTTAYDADGKVVGTYKGLTSAESEKLKVDALAKLAVAKKQYENGEISFSELAAAEKEAEADPNIQPISPDNSKASEDSMCSTVLNSAREALRECNRTGWKATQCQQLNARMHGCPDPTLIYVDPESGYACGAKVDPQLVIDAWVEGCKAVTLPGPDSDPCGPPKVNERGQIAWSSQKDICNNEIAYVGDPEQAGCIGTLKVNNLVEQNVNELILYALNKLGGPIVVLPIRDPPPPGVGPEPMPGPK